jgi:hypothetical protein
MEAIRALMAAKHSVGHERTQAINQARALILTGPDDLRARLPRPRSQPGSRRCGLARQRHGPPRAPDPRRDRTPRVLARTGTAHAHGSNRAPDPPIWIVWEVAG